MSTAIPTLIFFPPESSTADFPCAPPLAPPVPSGCFNTRTVLNSSNATAGSVKPINPNLGLIKFELVELPGKFPLESGWSYAMTVYVERMKGTPRMMSAISWIFDPAGYAWIIPMQEALCDVGVVRSSGCSGISGRLSSVMVMLIGVVQST